MSAIKFSRRLVVVLIAVVGVTSLALLIVSMSANKSWFDSSGKQSVQQSESAPLSASPILDMRSVSRLRLAVSRNIQLAAVRFTTDIETRERIQDGKSIVIRTPCTRVSEDLSDVNSFRVEGAFSVVQTLVGSERKWGSVVQSVPVSGSHSDSDARRRLGVLLNVTAENPSVLMLAIGGNQTGSPLDGEFLGPLADSDIGPVVELIRLLAGQPFCNMTQADAEGLLASNNPWLAWLALDRLRSLQVLRPSHFIQVLNARPPTEVEKILRDIFTADSGCREFRAQRTDTILQAIQLPSRQRAVLDFLRRNDWYVCQLSDLPKLQDGLKHYRDQIKDDPAMAEVLTLVDYILHKVESVM